MRKIISNIAIIFPLLILWGCPQPPEFPSNPKITFKNVTFYNNSETDPLATDSLVVTIHFEDGNGDLGLGPNETTGPYVPFYLLADTSKTPDDLILLGDNPDLPPYNPLDYYIFQDSARVTFPDNSTAIFYQDTAYIERNENFNNIFIRFFQKKNGSYKEFKWEDAPYYQSFNGRFPKLNTESYDRPLEGDISYTMISAGFRVLFRNDSLKLGVKIKDRALHDSNEITTPSFTLPSISR